ncbi:MAG: 5-formyltetrahydrofolate cyclo-ligase [Cellulomonadaceae bacterium]
MSKLAQPYPAHEGFETEDAKELLRSAVRAQRTKRSERRRTEAAQQFADVLEAIPELASARCVAAYVSRSTEPRTDVLLERLAARGVRVLLPVLGTGLERCWAEFAGLDDLQERAPGRPPEPGTPPLDAQSVAEADLVVTPALAVDTVGRRLGQGGGWYDRALSYCSPGTTVVSMVFPEEVYDAEERPLPHEGHDVPVHGAATPEQMLWFAADRA